MRLYLGNLAYSATETDVRNFFGERRLSEIKIMFDHDTGQPRGFGFVEIPDANEAQSALEMDGEDLLGRPLKVCIAHERQKGGNQGGGGRGRSRDHEKDGEPQRSDGRARNRDW